jgi:UDP-N-acetylmuramoyl-tripeptide--D-alanyl-D-alanine ligase
MYRKLLSRLVALILTLGELQQACGATARFVGNATQLTQRPSGISTDSRQCRADEIFIALRGERFDGHQFALEVLTAGALAAIVDAEWFERQKINEKAKAGNFILVEDTLLALQQIGHTIRRRWGKPVIAITGSNGKTTTKEMVAAVLAQEKVVHKTTGNLNNHIGVPMTLAELQHGHDLAVVEMATNHFGEIARLCEIADPNFGLITNIGRAHIEFFKDLDGVAKAKGELVESLQARSGIFFLNVDDPKLPSMLPSGMKAITFGIDHPAQVQAKITGVDDNGCVTMRWNDQPIHLAIPGTHNAINTLGAVALGEYFGIAPEKIRLALESIKPVSKRMQILRRGSLTIINDAYNANPDSMRVALEFLSNMPVREQSHRVAILGDMLELGDAAPRLHRELGELVSTLPIHAVFAFGPQMKHLVQAIGETLWTEHFEDKSRLAEEVRRSVRSGDVILVKGSRGMAMEEIIEKLPEGK